MCVKASVLCGGTDCHYFILQDDWPNLQKLYGIIFLSIPTVIDPSLPPEGHRILHIFMTTGIEDLEGLSRKDYEQKKELVSKEIIRKLEKSLFPGLQDSIVRKEWHRERGSYTLVFSIQYRDVCYSIFFYSFATATDLHPCFLADKDDKVFVVGERAPPSHEHRRP